MDWIVFGDDWGTHPSTAQHLVLNLPSADRVVWVDSIGMRNPTLNPADLRRIWGKAKMIFNGGDSGEALYQGNLMSLARVKPKVIPWHLNKAAVLFNTRSLSISIRHAMQTLGITSPVLMSSTPVVIQYLSAIPHRFLVYLRQDNYETYPGCDPALVRKTEPAMFDAAKEIFVTAKSLYPKGEYADKAHYLPHGVQFEHFARVPLEPSSKKILGFFGTIDERMDFQLVRDVAQAVPDWQLEFIGEIIYKPVWIDAIPNIRFRTVVPFSELPKLLSEWTAAWIPYLVNDVTSGINPLKLREYLAAGIPAHCVPLPETRMLDGQVMIGNQVSVICEWLKEILTTDTLQSRLVRRESVRGHDWGVRSQELRRIINEHYQGMA